MALDKNITEKMDAPLNRFYQLYTIYKDSVEETCKNPDLSRQEKDQIIKRLHENFKAETEALWQLSQKNK